MITVRLLGGLGNQMFQYAYGLALKEAGYDIEYDRSHLIEGTHREYSLGYFGINAVRRSTMPEIYEGGGVHILPPICTVIGYWQSEKYFAGIADKVREAFKFQERATVFGPTISVHVRRQDYIDLQHFHGMPTLDYYREAVAHIRRATGLLMNVLVFSDDTQWCRANFPSDFTVVEGQNKYDDLKLMAACDYHVIANSSYSWWGAWLSRDRMTVAPKQWFTDPNTDYSDIVPDRWIKL